MPVPRCWSWPASYGDPQPLRIEPSPTHTASPQRFLVQILLQLKTAGLVASVRGAAGGYQLARSPETISLAHDHQRHRRQQRVAAVALSAANRTQTIEVLLGVWHEIRLQEQRILEQISLAELLRRTQESNALTYQI